MAIRVTITFTCEGDHADAERLAHQGVDTIDNRIDDYDIEILGDGYKVTIEAAD